MSKYQELKNNKRSASDPLEEIKVHHALRHYERGAAELIERAQNVVSMSCEECRLNVGVTRCEQCNLRSGCLRRGVLAEMYELAKGGAK